MEWLLQAWDEIDDATAAIAQWCLGMSPLFSTRRWFTQPKSP